MKPYMLLKSITVVEYLLAGHTFLLGRIEVGDTTQQEWSTYTYSTDHIK